MYPVLLDSDLEDVVDLFDFMLRGRRNERAYLQDAFDGDSGDLEDYLDYLCDHNDDTARDLRG